MTDEEMAEDWITKKKLNNRHFVDVVNWDGEEPTERFYNELKLKQAFLAGLGAGRPKWHKVADGDLPEAENNFWSRTVLLQTNKGSSMIGFYDHANKAWYEKSTDDIVYGVVAWCEIPKYNGGVTMFFEQEAKRLEWTDLKVGDVIQCGKVVAQVTVINAEKGERHIFAGDVWLDNSYIRYWKKVEE